MKRNVVEWAVLGTSIIAIVLVVAMLALDGLSEERPADPRVDVLVDEARSGAAGWIVPATVVNQGDAAAEAVLIEAAAGVGGTQEVSEVTVDFLPAGSRVDVSFAFSAQPETEISIRLVSFRSP